jgi:hypothetical protein
VLLINEDEAAYTRMFESITDDIEPEDIIEEFWVRDVVDLLWEALRLRRFKAALLASSLADGLERVLAPALGHSKALELSKRWYVGEDGAREQVDGWLNQLGLTTDAILAHTLSKKLDDVERIDRMLANAEARRHVVLREIDRRRAAVATRLRAAAEAIEDGEYSEVARSEIAPAAAA